MIRQFYRLSFENKELFDELWTLCAHPQTVITARTLTLSSNVFANFIFRLAEKKFRKADFVVFAQHVMADKLNRYVKEFPITMLIKN